MTRVRSQQPVGHRGRGSDAPAPFFMERRDDEMEGKTAKEEGP